MNVDKHLEIFVNKGIDVQGWHCRAVRFIEEWHRGAYHCPLFLNNYPDKRMRELVQNSMIEYNIIHDLATYDFDHLTRAVILAHKHCLRFAVCPSGPGMLKVRLWPRDPDGKTLFTRHPSLDDLIIMIEREKEDGNGDA